MQGVACGRETRRFEIPCTHSSPCSFDLRPMQGRRAPAGVSRESSQGSQLQSFADCLFCLHQTTVQNKSHNNVPGSAVYLKEPCPQPCAKLWTYFARRSLVAIWSWKILRCGESGEHPES